MGFAAASHYIARMSENPVDLHFIAKQLDRVLEEQRLMRREMDDVRSLVIGLADQNRRIDRHIGEFRPILS